MQFEAIQDLFDRTAAAHAGKTALEWRGEGLTYRELEARSHRLARYLVESGVAPGALVAILADDPFVLVPALLGILKAGAGFVPLDPSFPDLRLGAMLRRSAPALIFSQPAVRERAEWLCEGATRVVSIGSHAGEGEIFDPTRGPSARPEGIVAAPDSRAYVYFTSGSTGEPKGIVGRLKAIDHFIRWEIDTLELGPGVRVSQLTTPSFDASLRDFFVPLCSGGVVCVPESRRTVLDGHQLVEWLDLEEIAVLHCVPSVFRSVLAADLKPSYFRALRYVLLAGEPLLPSDVGRWMDVFGDRVHLVNLYGPSETTMTKLFYRVQPEDRDRRSIPIGRPMRGARALLLDPQKRPSAAGSVGEIYIRTPFRSLGYLDDPEMTKQSFIQNPFNEDPEDRVFRTGDMARVLPSGDFEFLGRRDQQVKIQGVRVELGEIESLLRKQAGVRDGVVIDREDGTGGKALCAYVVLDEDKDLGSLRESLRESLPDPLMPAAFIALEELPRTLTGKVDRRALPHPASAAAAEGDLTPPRTPVEELLAGLWCDLLRLKAVGVHQSFFELGGHSLLVTQLLSRVRASFGVALPLDSVFEQRTISGLAQAIERHQRADAGLSIPPPVPLPRTEDPPLSFAQERLWVLDRLDPGNPTYNVPLALELLGSFAVVPLRRALDEVVQRQEALRTLFPALRGRPVQSIQPPRPVPLPLIDLSALPEELREEERRRLVAREALARFDLTREAALRASLLLLAADRALLLVTLHHIVSDDWSVALLMEEWAACYASLTANRKPSLPPLPVQYADFALWQRRWISGDVLDTLIAFWRPELARAAPLLSLPLDRPRSPRATYRGGRQSIQLSPELTRMLTALSRSEGATLFMTTMASLQALLWRYGGQDSFAVGTPVAGRQHVEVEKLIGFFINNLPIRSDFSGDPTFREYLARTRRVLLDAFAHQDLPFEKLVEALRPERDPSFSPIYQVVLALHNTRQGDEAPPLAGLSLERMAVDTGLVKVDLDFDLIEKGESLVGSLAFNMDLFDSATAWRLTRHLERLLAAVAADPSVRVSEIPLLEPEERRQIVDEGQGPALPAEEPPSFPDVVAGWAARTPDQVAVEHGETYLTYRELDRRANQLARFLRNLGVGSEMIVAAAVDRGPDLVVAFLGILRSGGAYLPLDASYPAERLEFMLEDAGVSVLLTQDEISATLPVFYGFSLSLDSSWSLIAVESDEPLAPVTVPENLAYVIYTSGSTGRPKGVLATHGGLARITPSYARLAGPGRRILQFASPGFDASIAEIVTALASGATLVTAARSEMAPGPDLNRLLRDRRVTDVTLVPSTLAVTPAGDLPDLSMLIAAGEALTAEVAERWSAPGRRLHNFYGPTEGTIWASAAECRPGEAPTLGLPNPGVTLHIFDERGELALPGVAGELFLGGAGVTRGYLGRQDLTAERFVPDPLASLPGARLYRTGDLVRRRKEGLLEFLGRVDQQVKIRGFRIELGEVETVLAQHPGVESAAVLVRPGEDRLSAYWSPAQEPGPSARELRELLAHRLPAHCVPAELISLSELPRNASGKVDRRALAAIGVTGGEGPESFRAPEDPLEELLVGIFSDVLNTGTVGADGDFFQLGGYSLAAAQVLSRIEDLLGIQVAMDRLFDNSTPAALASDLRRLMASREAGKSPPPLVEGNRQEDLPLTFEQELLWLAHRKEPDRLDDHVPFFLRIEGDLDVEALGRAFDEIRRRHEVLRTAILEKDGTPVQRVLFFVAEPVPYKDLRDLPAEERDREAREEVVRFCAQPFDLTSGQVQRWKLLQVGDESYVLALVWHHIATDPWSGTLFWRELSTLYMDFVAGRPSSLPELPLQIGDFALWQRRWAGQESFARHLDFWGACLAGVRPVDLPLDRPRAGLRSAPMARQGGILREDLVRRLRTLGREEGATLFMTCLAGFYLFLHSLTGQRDLSIWSPAAKRSRQELEQLIGFFAHATVLRCEVSEDIAFRSLLRQVRKTALEALSHQDLPYEILASRFLPELCLGWEPMRISSNYIHASEVPVALPGLRISAFDLAFEHLMEGDLELLFREVNGILHYSFNYRVDLLDAETLAAWAESYEALLQAIVEEPDLRLDDLCERIESGGEPALS